MDPYGDFYRTVLWPAWESGVRRRPTLARLAELEQSQWRTADELRASQSEALVRLVRHAWAHVPWYRGRMRALGLEPGDVRSIDDLARLPLLEREEARRHARERESTAGPVAEIRKQTSGTTGEPLVIAYERDSEVWRQAVRLRGYRWAGYRPADPTLHFWGAPLHAPPPATTRAKIALDRMLRREWVVPCAVMGDDALRAVAREIDERRPKLLVCYAQAGAELARFVLREGLRRWRSVRVVCGAERLLPSDRADLEEAFGPVFETYGCREVMLIAAECEAHDGMHVSMENLAVELVVREPGGGTRAARPGEVGEIVITDLHNLAAPFLRYANGDVAVAAAEAPCACGRGLARIRSVEGRTTDQLRDARGRPVSGLAVSFLFHDLGARIRRFQLVQHADGSVTLRIVPDSPAGDALIDLLRGRCERLLSGARARVEVVGDLPRSPAGKHQLVVVEAAGA